MKAFLSILGIALVLAFNVLLLTFLLGSIEPSDRWWLIGSETIFLFWAFAYKHSTAKT